MEKYAWILFIIVIIANILLMKVRSKKYIERNPTLEDGFKKIFKAILIYGNLPWVIMGLGILLGFTKSVFEYLSPRSLNPFVLFFDMVCIFILIMTTIWIYFKNGAEFLTRHQILFTRSDLFEKESMTTNQIKIWIGLMLIGGYIGMVLMWML